MRQILLEVSGICQNQIGDVFVRVARLEKTLIDLKRIFHRGRNMLRAIPGNVVQVDRFLEIFKTIAVQFHGSNRRPMAYLVCDEMVQRSVHRVRRLELAMRIGRGEVTGTALIVNIDPSHIDPGQAGDEGDFVTHFFEWAQGGHREKIRIVLTRKKVISHKAHRRIK